MDNSVSTQQTTLPPVLTLSEVQTYLRLGRTKTFELAREGRIPGCRRIGRQYRIVRDEFLRGLAEDEPQENAAGMAVQAAGR